MDLLSRYFKMRDKEGREGRSHGRIGNCKPKKNRDEKVGQKRNRDEKIKGKRREEEREGKEGEKCREMRR